LPRFSPPALIYPRTKIRVPGLGLFSVAPATPVSITIIGPSIAIAVIGSVRSIAIRVWSVVTAAVVVAGLLKQRVRDSGTITRA